MDVARVSFAHSTIAESIELMRRIRKIAPHVGILPDLPGPKIRSAPFPENGIVLETGSELLLAPGSTTPKSSAARIGVSDDQVLESLAEGIADLYPRFGRTMEWDTGAPQAVLEAAGGAVRTLAGGERLRYGKPGWENPAFVCTGLE